MDLSNFSKSLPLSIEPTDEAINNMNKEISDEFKCGARSIAALYRLSNTKNHLLIAKGYVDCLDEILKLLDSEKISSVEDLKNFIQFKKHDLSPDSLKASGRKSSIASEIETDDTNKGNNKDIDNLNKKNRNTPPQVTESFISKAQPTSTKLDDSYKFTVSNPTSHHFPKSRIPISIDHSNIKYQKHKKSLKKSIDHSSDEEIEGTDNEPEYENSDLSFDETTDSFSKRKILDSSSFSAHKKPKF